MGDHSFQDVMKQWKRMCEYNVHNRCCIKCVLYITGECKGDSVNGTDYSFLKNGDFEFVEEKVMEWAENHPEPEYPSWIEWLESQGLIGRNADGGHIVKTRIFTPIPVEIAKKLGIEPKEVSPGD